MTNNKSHYIYISSKNRDIGDNIYDFNIILNNPIILKNNEGMNISVVGFTMLNTDYNCKNLNFIFQIEYITPTIYYITHQINIPDGNYSYITLINLLNSNTIMNPFIKFEYIKERNTIKFINISSYKLIITPNNSNKILGINSTTNILANSNYEGSYINLTNYSHIIIKSNTIIFEDITQDNFNDKEMGNSSILFLIDKQDIMPFQLISYKNYDKSDNFSHNISNKNINIINLQLYNEKNEFLTNTDDYFLILKVVIFEKEKIDTSNPLLEDIRFLLMGLMFDKKNNLSLK